MDLFNTLGTSFLSGNDRWLGYDKGGNSGWLEDIPSETDEDINFQELNNIVDEMKQEQNRDKIKKEQPIKPRLPEL